MKKLVIALVVVLGTVMLGGCIGALDPMGKRPDKLVSSAQ